MRVHRGVLSVAAIALAGFAWGEGRKMKMEDLPAPVQAAVKSQTSGATILSISSEKEKGKVEYEVETKVNGKGHDLTFDAQGAVLEIEDETDLDSIPKPAKTAIQQQAGTLVKVEKVTKGAAVQYVATLKPARGKNMEVGVDAAGKLLFKEKAD